MPHTIEISAWLYEPQYDALEQTLPRLIDARDTRSWFQPNSRNRAERNCVNSRRRKNRS